MEKNEFESGIKEILNASDRDEKLTPKNGSPKLSCEKRKKNLNNSYSTKKVPLWLTLSIRLIAGAIAFLLLMKYAANIAYN